VVPLLLLIVDFAIHRRHFANTYMDTAFFYYVVMLPINICNRRSTIVYSKFHKPVYRFLRYDCPRDYIIALACGILMILLHQCLAFLMEKINIYCKKPSKNKGMSATA
jgi:hypothetical protein